MPEALDFGNLANQISTWLRERVTEAGATHLVLGLSGGIDSAVVCSLAARAVGSSRVIAAILPIASQASDLADAEIVAEALDVKPITIDLTPVYDSLVETLPSSAISGDSGNREVALANIKPRLRMTTLYYLAQVHNGLVVGTGNKVELSIGYFTKYGDGGVDLLPIGDLTKTEVRAMALELGVPASIIAKPPSAGLWTGQTDEGEIGLTYAQLERAIQNLLDGTAVATDDPAYQQVEGMIRRSEHKRQPIPLFSARRFRVAAGLSL